MSVEISEVWRKYWDTKPDFKVSNSAADPITILASAALDKLKGRPDISVIDIACGPGSRTIPLFGMERNIKLVMLDRAANALEIAQDHASAYNVPVTFIQADAFNVPLRSNSFDFVFSYGLNEHFLDPLRQELFNEMARIVRPDGILAIVVPNRNNPFHSVSKLIAQSRGTWPYGPQYDFTPAELKARMAKAGLVNIESLGAGAYTSWIHLMRREARRKYYRKNTISGINKLLWKLDAEPRSFINRHFGREIMAIGHKS